MPSAHARLSPSAASRWISCPASVQLAADAPRESSSFADQGTAAHALAELQAREHLLGQPVTAAETVQWREEHLVALGDLDEQAAAAEHVAAYVDLLRSILDELPGSALLLEQRMATGIDGCWGTGDGVIVAPEEIVVVDLKYGAGVPVSPVNNAQLMLYGCGALDAFDGLVGDCQTVRLVIFQPRYGDGEPRSWSISADELRAWRERIRPIAASALDGTGGFGPSESACRRCPVAATCRARFEQVTQQDFGTPPPTLSPEELAEALDLVPGMRAWCTAVEKHARGLAIRGTPVAGYKLVRRPGRRAIDDPERLIGKLRAEGYGADDVAELKPRTFAHLERLVGGRKAFDALCGEYVSLKPGSIAHVPEDAPGAAINAGDLTGASAAEDFA